MSALSPINRESELRTDAAKLAQLWKTAHIIHLVDARLSAGDDSLTFIDAAAVEVAQEVFVEGDRFFLGIGRDDKQAYFAWHTTWINPPEDDGTEEFEKRKYEGFKSLREVGGNLDADELALAMHAVGLANWHATQIPWKNILPPKLQNSRLSPRQHFSCFLIHRSHLQSSHQPAHRSRFLGSWTIYRNDRRTLRHPVPLVDRDPNLLRKLFPQSRRELFRSRDHHL